MQRTLFLIPHEVAGIPVFGFGWALLLLLAAVAVYLGFVWRNGESVVAEIKQGGWFVALLAIAIVFVLPRIELHAVSTTPGQPGPPVGIAVRGYGAMMLLGVVAAVALAVYRAPKRGLTGEHIFGLAPWLLIPGIVGARLFYVIEYFDQFRGPTLATTLGNMLNFTGGGLVVYGSIMGGLVGTMIYGWRNRIPLLRLGDVIIPCVFLGIAFGRLGCLLNGCCYGGRCEEAPWTLQFPVGSPLYTEQLLSGELVGLTFATSKSEPLKLPAPVQSVVPGSLADQAGIKPQQTVTQITPLRTPLDQVDQTIPAEDLPPAGLRVDVAGRTLTWSESQLPPRSTPVWPSQPISSLSTLALCLGLLALSPRVRRYDGALVVAGFAGYACIRFGLETIRSDEPGQFGTGLTIAQWVSLAILIATAALAVSVFKRPQEAAE